MTRLKTSITHKVQDIDNPKGRKAQDIDNPIYDIINLIPLIKTTDKGGYQMEQKRRTQAIERYLKGEIPKSIYNDLKRSKYWFFKWLKRYKSGEPEWYKDKSKAPINRPTEISKVERQRIISTRTQLESQQFAQIGPSAIKWELSKSGFSLPSDSTIKRVLKSEGLIKKNFVCSKGR